MPCMDLLFWCRLWTEVDSRNCFFLMLISYFGSGLLFVYGGGHLFVYGGDPFSRLRIRYCHFYFFISWKNNGKMLRVYFEYLLTLIMCLEYFEYFEDQILPFLSCLVLRIYWYKLMVYNLITHFLNSNFSPFWDMRFMFSCFLLFKGF